MQPNSNVVLIDSRTEIAHPSMLNRHGSLCSLCPQPVTQIEILVNAQTVEVSAKLTGPSFQTIIRVNLMNTSRLSFMMYSPSVHFDPDSGTGLLK